MENLNSEILAAKERELAECNHTLHAMQKKYAEREKDFNPYTRLAMAITAQISGYILLSILGSYPFDSGQVDIARGLEFIKRVAMYYLIMTIAILVIPSIYAFRRRQLNHVQVDIVLLVYVISDLVVLLFLVHQQGGLCRSMFLPVFFLIPIAYLLVERRERKRFYRLRRVGILLCIVGCIIRCYYVALWYMPPIGSNAGKPVEGIVSLFGWSKHITDFQTLAHAGYDKALFAASLISAFVPILQLIIVAFQERFNESAG